MSNWKNSTEWVEDRGRFEIDVIYKRNIYNIGPFGIGESIRMVRYPVDSYIISPNGFPSELDNSVSLTHRRFTYLREEYGFSHPYWNVTKHILKLLSFIINKGVVIIDFKNITKSKYMKYYFVIDIVRKYDKEYSRNETLKNLGI